MKVVVVTLQPDLGTSTENRTLRFGVRKTSSVFFLWGNTSVQYISYQSEGQKYVLSIANISQVACMNILIHLVESKHWLLENGQFIFSICWNWCSTQLTGCWYWISYAHDRTDVWISVGVIPCTGTATESGHWIVAQSGEWHGLCITVSTASANGNPGWPVSVN